MYSPSLLPSITYTDYKPPRPTLLNASAGLLTTLISIYTGHDGSWSVIAILAALASGLSALFSLVVLGIYYKKLFEIKREHRQITRGARVYS